MRLNDGGFLFRTIPVALALALSFATACGRDAPFLGRVSDSGGLIIDPAELEVYEGLEFQVDVLAIGENGFERINGQSDLSIDSSDSRIVTIGADGKGRAIKSGQASI